MQSASFDHPSSDPCLPFILGAQQAERGLVGRGSGAIVRSAIGGASAAVADVSSSLDVPGLLLGPCTRALHVYTGGNPADLYFRRAATNGRSALWAGPAGHEQQLHTVFSADDNTVHSLVFDHETRLWASASPSDATSAPPPSDGGKLTPNLALTPDREVVVSWIQRTTSSTEGGYLVLETVIPYMGHAMRLLWAAPGPWPSDFKPTDAALYLSASSTGGGRRLVAETLRRPSAENEATAQDVTVGAGATDVLLSYYELDGDPSTTRRATSDPTVAVTSDGSLGVYVWEENSLSDGAKKIAFRTQDLGIANTEKGLRDPQLINNGEATGGDPSVCFTQRSVYVAYQSIGGAQVFLLRADLADLALDAPEVVWTPVSTALSLPDDRVGGELGRGWLPQVHARTIDGVDHVAVVWERTTGDFIDPTNRSVELAFATYTPGGTFEVLSRRVWPAPDPKTHTYRIAAQVAVGPLGSLGFVPVDVFWMRVTTDGDGLLKHGLLLHRTYEFDGPCVL
jgi:hypothetical protein